MGWDLLSYAGVLLRQDTTDSSRGSKRVAVCKPRRGASDGASTLLSPMILDFQLPEMRENKFLLLKLPKDWGAFLC